MTQNLEILLYTFYNEYSYKMTINSRFDIDPKKGELIYLPEFIEMSRIYNGTNDVVKKEEVIEHIKKEKFGQVFKVVHRHSDIWYYKEIHIKLQC